MSIKKQVLNTLYIMLADIKFSRANLILHNMSIKEQASLLAEFEEKCKNVIDEIDKKQNIYVPVLTPLRIMFCKIKIVQSELMSDDISIEKQMHIFAKLDKECTNYIADTELLCNSELLN
jgi:flagellar biosynthesis component FlhA